MKAIDFIREVETKYNVRSIKVKNMEVWPFLRAMYFFAYINKYDYGELCKDESKSILFRLRQIKNVFYGINNFFKKYDYLVFSDIGEIRLMNGVYVNRLAEFLISELGKEKVLLIENPQNGSHFKRSEISVQNIISFELLRLVCSLSYLRKRLIINNESILKEINKKFGLNINYTMLISKFIFVKNLFRFFFRIYKPRLIFLSDYYNLPHQAAIYTAKKMGIKTIELQHGCICKVHCAYNVFARLDESFFPDYLFSAGENDKNVFDEQNYFIRRENVIPVGSMYIDYINNEYKASEETVKIISNFRRKYRKIVAVSSQDGPVENLLIGFLKKSAALSKDILYIFVPRDVSGDYSSAKFPENIVISEKLNVYQIIKEVDFHSTMFSTCALEAPVLGVPNILINIDNYAKKYFWDMLTNQNVTRFVDTEKQFVDTILNWQIKTKKEIMNLHSNFYKPNHKKNIQQALRIMNKV